MSRLLIIILLSLTVACGHAQNSKDEPLYIEDVLQYVPTATAFALRLSGVGGNATVKEQLIKRGIAFVAMYGSVQGLKHTVHRERPDHSDNESFPSGHTAVAFTGADMLFTEYRDVSPWIGIGGYAVATTTGILRMVHDRHHWTDVMAGAAIGIGSSRLSQWLTPIILGKKKREEGTSVSSTPFVSDEGWGLAVSVNF